MLMQRDKDVLRWVEHYGAITLKQATTLFFNEIYKSASRRLNQLEENKFIKSYISKSKKEKVYYLDKKVSDHRLYIYDYIRELKRLNCEVIDIEIEPQYLDGAIRPDAYVTFKSDGYKYITLLEVDFTHYTSNSKLNTLYEKLYEERDKYREFSGTFPIVVIARPTPGIRYNSNNFEVVYTGLDYANLPQLLLD